ncbi:MAG: hypothetical protein IT381_16295 [Deltaproteobacteria bacterium]|nr:hypothetical protein [Deltaproteobacteria bacterium]
MPEQQRTQLQRSLFMGGGSSANAALEVSDQIVLVHTTRFDHACDSQNGEQGQRPNRVVLVTLEPGTSEDRVDSIRHCALFVGDGTEFASDRDARNEIRKDFVVGAEERGHILRLFAAKKSRYGALRLLGIFFHE